MKNENLEWIDSLRTLATIGVIFLHVAAPILYQYGNIPNSYWWIGNIYDGSVRFCVPLFLMISGTLILSKTYGSIQEYLKKRLMRILFPFLFWSLIYITKDLIINIHHGKYLGLNDIFMFIFIQLKTGASYHLWYIYLLIGLYLFFPIIIKWIHKSTQSEIIYFLGIWVITILTPLPFMKKIIPNIEISYFSGYIGLPVLGLFLHKTTINLKNKTTIYSLMIFTGILVTILGTFFYTQQDGKFYELFYYHLSFNAIFTSAGIFLLFRSTIKSNCNIILFISKYSYGIYLIHVLILSILEIFGFSYNFINPFIGVPVTSVLCLIISSLIIWSINKLPWGKYISG